MAVGVVNCEPRYTDTIPYNRVIYRVNVKMQGKIGSIGAKNILRTTITEDNSASQQIDCQIPC